MPFTAILAIGAILAGATPSRGVPPAPVQQLVVWAWERPEDLRFLPADVEIAALSGFIELRGNRLIARGRRFPLLARHGQISTSVVHVQISHAVPLAWTPELRAQTAAAVFTLATHIPTRRLQIDFEARLSERQVLLDVIGDVKRELPAGVALSMTALASWCQTEDWIGTSGAEEIAPMLFRMGGPGEAIRAELSAGADFRQPACRSALAVSTDSPLSRAPWARRIYLFNPKSWTQQDFEQQRGEIEGWRARDGVKRSPQG